MKPWERCATTLVIGASITLFACSDSDNPPGSGKTANASVGTAACLLQAAQSPCDLLSIELTRTTFPMTPSDAAIDQDVSTYSSSCTVSWSAGRTSTVGTGNYAMEVDINDSISLSNIRKVDADTFLHQHRTISREEKAQAAQRAEKAVQAKADDGVIDKRYEQEGKNFAKSLINKMQWDSIPGLGDHAAWGGVGRFKTLNVLVDNAMFSIRAEMSNEESKILEASKLAAAAIINTCE
ncbi:hypothetical protein QWI17_18465 [Gilvimarinus sp. SDUM040013]|uniref:DUF3558 domain-containing protein n=1 Tax=Gilvimarinus gilvus TaxID=3058038 RepID=A0ABU4RVB5_9GAMM|nr:hypothetical protein [Gilvimarinus sp. SDUM040013]MDO3387834.1 hypothetical protein [Gilvimarinus sp. SDUM040013]MDX6848795.1 hypothetical protein [Gilvimarinus sp. SDUM040013]